MGALRAAARGDRIVWAVHRAALANGIVPVVPVAAIAEAFRTEARGDRLEALLAGAEVEDARRRGGRRVPGELAARADTADLVAVAAARWRPVATARWWPPPHRPLRAAAAGSSATTSSCTPSEPASASVGRRHGGEPAQGGAECAGALAHPEQLGGQVVLLAGPGLVGQGGHPPGKLVEDER